MKKTILVAIVSLLAMIMVGGCSDEDTSSADDNTLHGEYYVDADLQHVTADDIPSLAEGDFIEIDCYAGTFSERAHDDTNIFVNTFLHVKDSNGVEWDVDGQDVTGATDEIDKELRTIVGEHGSLEEVDYNVTIRGIIDYVGEGEEGSGHPHGINFEWGQAEITKLEAK